MMLLKSFHYMLIEKRKWVTEKCDDSLTHKHTEHISKTNTESTLQYSGLIVFSVIAVSREKICKKFDILIARFTMVKYYTHYKILLLYNIRM